MITHNDNPPAVWQAEPMVDSYGGSSGSAEGTSANPILLVHQLLRGRYLKAIMIGVVLAAIGVVIGLKAIKPVYTSTAEIRILPYLPRILYTTSENQVMPMFSAYVASQTALIKSQDTIDLAMQNPKWAALKRGLTPQAQEDFAKSLAVVRLPGSEIISIDFSDLDPQAAVIGAGAIVNAYNKLYGQGDYETQNLQMRALRDRQTVLENDLQSTLTQINALSSQYGVNGLSVVYNYKLNLMTKIDSQWQEARIALAKVGAAAATEKAGRNKKGSAGGIATAELTDATLQQMQLQAMGIAQRIHSLELEGLGKNNHEVLTQQAKLDALRQEEQLYRQRLKSKPPIALTGPTAIDPSGLPVSLAMLKASEKQLHLLYQRVKSQTLELGTRYSKVLSLQQHSDYLRQQLQHIKQRVEAINMEAATGGRVRIISAGSQPGAPSKDLRKPAAAALGLLGLLLGFAVMALVGFTHGNMRDSADVNITTLGTRRMLGIVPQLPTNGAAMPLDLAMGAHVIHRIRGLLQVQAATPGPRALAFTSPAAGAGKTSLAIALAMSYAASGARTLLIDADIVTGTLTDRMGIPRSRRIGEIMVEEKLITPDQLHEAIAAAKEARRPIGWELLQRGLITPENLDRVLASQRRSRRGLLDAAIGKPLDNCVSRTKIKNLDVLALGRAKPHHANHLSPAAIRVMIQNAKSMYDMVLVDTGPVLGSLESALIAGQVDGVVLVVARGETRGLIERATSYLTNVGARLEGVIFNRANEKDVSRNQYSYTSSYRDREDSSTITVHEPDPATMEALRKLGPLACAVGSSVQSADEDTKHESSQTGNPGDKPAN